MTSDLIRAKALLAQGAYTCVLCRDGLVLTDKRRGIRPLLELQRSGQDLLGACAADKAIGKAAAFLYLLMGVAAVYAPIISTPAISVLEQAGIAVYYDLEVPAIQNRSRSGLCPMETAVRDIDTPQAALIAIEQTLANMK